MTNRDPAITQQVSEFSKLVTDKRPQNSHLDPVWYSTSQICFQGVYPDRAEEMAREFYLQTRQYDELLMTIPDDFYWSGEILRRYAIALERKIDSELISGKTDSVVDQIQFLLNIQPDSTTGNFLDPREIVYAAIWMGLRDNRFSVEQKTMLWESLTQQAPTEFAGSRMRNIRFERFKRLESFDSLLERVKGKGGDLFFPMHRLSLPSSIYAITPQFVLSALERCFASLVPDGWIDQNKLTLCVYMDQILANGSHRVQLPKKNRYNFLWVNGIDHLPYIQSNVEESFELALLGLVVERYRDNRGEYPTTWQQVANYTQETLPKSHLYRRYPFNGHDYIPPSSPKLNDWVVYSFRNPEHELTAPRIDDHGTPRLDIVWKYDLPNMYPWRLGKW